MAGSSEGRPRMRNVTSLATFLCALACTTVLTVGGCARQQASPHGPPPLKKVALDQPAPPFVLKDIDGNTLSLAQFRGKPVFLNAFATWCPPCKQELPEIVQRYPQYKDKIVFIGIDEQEDAELVKPFLKRFGITYTVVLDPGDVAEHYAITSLPQSFFIDKAGAVRAMYRGFMTTQVLESNLRKVLQ